jgi:4-amino-4-deoxy-L-arabinose transferase-like glycosyltransferase
MWKRARLRFVATALDARRTAWLALALIGLNVVGWGIILTVARFGEALNFDSTEAYGWGRLWLWGYVKHPPLTGWVARLWFDVSPTADWAMYALAMAIVGAAAWLSWLLAIRVVDRRRAMLVVLLLLIYPIFNFRGSRFTPDLVQIPLFVAVVLVFVVAFEARSIAWGIALGLVCAAAVLTKYWALLVVGAIGLAAIAHPERARFFRSWTPYIAGLVFLAALAPHLVWLVRSDYAPFEYAQRHLQPTNHSPLAQDGIVFGHYLALLLPVALVLAWAVCFPRLRPPDHPAVRLDRARHIWLIAVVLVVLPPILTVAFGVYFAVDWGVPLYTLLPLAVVAIPRLGIGRRALARAAAIWAIWLAAALAAAPLVPIVQAKFYPERYRLNAPDVAEKVSRLWRERYGSPLPVVAGPKLIAAPISFYGSEHPILFTNFDRRIATWSDVDALRRSGFAAVCPEQASWFCETALHALGIAPTERVVVSQQPHPLDRSPSMLRWSVYFVPPGR